MVVPESKLVERFAAFEDTQYLSDLLYSIAHDEDFVSSESKYVYELMEARDNLLGLYALCRSFVVAHEARCSALQSERGE